MSSPKLRRPRLALPYTVLAESDKVRLVAGEDFRYTLGGDGLERWLPAVLAACDGRRTLDELLAQLEPALRSAALQLLERLYAERVLVDGTAADAHVAATYRLVVAGVGALADALRACSFPTDLLPLSILCQDRLDYDEARQFNRQFVAGGTAWMWATTGPMSRGYVSPPFLPGAGPCLACLLQHFQYLSPAPEFYDALTQHARAGLAIAPVPFFAQGIEILRQLVLWKVDQLQRSDPPAALYRLHVLEVESMEVNTHRVFVDPECPECGDATVV